MDATVTPQNGTVSRVDFSSSNTGVASVNPVSDYYANPYRTVVTSVSSGSSAILKARVFMSGVFRCENTTNVTITPPGPWWQVKDSDVFSEGNITSLIPPTCTTPSCQPFFDLNGLGGYPGIPIYSENLNLGSATDVSSTGWHAQTTINMRMNYSLSYFEQQIPQDTEIIEIPFNSVEGSFFSTLPDYNTYWYKLNSSQNILTINSNVAIGSRKIVLILDGANLYINGKINLADGNGMFLVLAGKTTNGDRGNIYINASVGGNIDTAYDIEGLYFTENRIYTGAGSIPLQVRGSLVALTGINLQRNLVNNNSLTPSELIEYAPDQFILMSKVLNRQKINWKEVQP